MALTPTPYGNNPFQPGVAQDVFIPDQLIADPRLILTHGQRTITGGAYYKRGTVLGRITASNKLTIATAAANDGSQTPVEILADDVDATAGDVNGGTYGGGEFNANAVILGAGITLAAARDALAANRIFLRTPVSAADPT
ncbi:head decoration protein [Sphingomonas paucimobilis]|uniref:head decoration protein n=1 Tax=Sphingomonas paucimobilis TaxID=13689 RepID=UPI00064C13FA|nr:head decoration protein [Sphingomonas paucimobilis]